MCMCIQTLTEIYSLYVCVCVFICGISKQYVYYNQTVSWNVNFWLFPLSHRCTNVSYLVRGLQIDLRKIQIPWIGMKRKTHYFPVCVCVCVFRTWESNGKILRGVRQVENLCIMDQREKTDRWQSQLPRSRWQCLCQEHWLDALRVWSHFSVYEWWFKCRLMATSTRAFRIRDTPGSGGDHAKLDSAACALMRTQLSPSGSQLLHGKVQARCQMVHF